MSVKKRQPYLTVYDVTEAGAWSGEATFKRDASPDRVAATVRALVEANAELTSLRAEVERLRTGGEALAKALGHDDTDVRLCGSCTEAGLAQERCDVGCFAREQAWLEMTGAALAEWEKP